MTGARLQHAGGGGGIVAMMFGAVASGLSWLMGFQALLNLQFLPSQIDTFIRSVETAFNLSPPIAATLFFAQGTVIWLFGFAVGRATA